MTETTYESKGKTGEYKAYFLELYSSIGNGKTGGLEDRTGPALTEAEKIVVRRLAKEFGFSVDRYETDLQAKLQATNGSVDVALDLNEELRILHDLRDRADANKQD